MVALPIVTIMAMIWLYLENESNESNESNEKIVNHAWYTFWYVIPTLPMFLLFPILLKVQ
jgi:hypothetical protein